MESTKSKMVQKAILNARKVKLDEPLTLVGWGQSKVCTNIPSVVLKKLIDYQHRTILKLSNQSITLHSQPAM